MPKKNKSVKNASQFTVSQRVDAKKFLQILVTPHIVRLKRKKIIEEVAVKITTKLYLLMI